MNRIKRFFQFLKWLISSEDYSTFKRRLNHEVIETEKEILK